MHALSIPTWMIHILSVVEWMVAIGLVWIYADITQNRAWKGMAIAMLPAWVSAICVCTWHWLDNAPAFAGLGMAQAIMTFVGNCTLMVAGWWLWRQTFRVRSSR